MNTSSWGPHPAARALLTVQLCSLYSALAYCLFYWNMSHSPNPGAKPLSDVRHAPRLLEGAIIARSRQPPPPLPPSPLCAFPRLPSSFYAVTDWMTGDGCCCGWRSVAVGGGTHRGSAYSPPRSLPGNKTALPPLPRPSVLSSFPGPRSPGPSIILRQSKRRGRSLARQSVCHAKKRRRYFRTKKYANC